MEEESILSMAKKLSSFSKKSELEKMKFTHKIGSFFGIDIILQSKGATELDAKNLRSAEHFLTEILKDKFNVK